MKTFQYKITSNFHLKKKKKKTLCNKTKTAATKMVDSLKFEM